MLWIILFVIILFLTISLYFYFAISRTHFFVIDKSAILDNRVIEILKKIPVEIKLLVPKFILDDLNETLFFNNFEAEIAKKGLENFATLKNLENIKIKIYNPKKNESPGINILKIAKKYNCKILTTDFDLYMKAKTDKIKILNLDDISEIFNKNWMLGDTITAYLSTKERQDGIAYLYDGTKIIVLNASDYVDKKVVCKIFKVTKDMSEKKVFTKFLRLADN
jgi:uncharacterized protein YacL